MASGGPGDHWFTDIFTWNLPAFGEPSDTLIRDIRRFGGADLLADGQPLSRRLWELWPHWAGVDERHLEQLSSDLATVRDELRRSAVARRVGSRLAARGSGIFGWQGPAQDDPRAADADVFDLSLVHGGCAQRVGHDHPAVAGWHAALFVVVTARVGQPSRKRFEVTGQKRCKDQQAYVTKPWVSVSS